MIKSLFGGKDPSTKKSEREEAIEAFSKICANWNLEQIQNYVRGRDDNHKLTDAGLAAIILKFINHKSHDKKAPNGHRREFEPYDRVERTKKGLDIVLAIMVKSEFKPESLELVKAFTEHFADVIQDLDKQLSQTYAHKLKETYKQAHIAALTKSKMKRALDISFDK